MYTTAVDYARFVNAVLNAKALDGERMTAMLTPQIEVDQHNSWSLGFGIQRDGNGDAFWQWGDYGIFRNFVIAYEQAKSAIVYLTNSYYGLSIGRDMVRRALGGEVHALEWLGYPRYDAPGVQLTWAVLEEGVDAALARMPDIRARDPAAISENDVNRLGYAFLNAERYDEAIGLFEHNVREHPKSANTYDSLAEAFMRRDAEGDIEQAIEHYHKSLEIIPVDPRPDREFLQRLRVNAERQIRDLEKRRTGRTPFE
jgi:tetratricopeptide (TPR) repeat protein